MPRSRYDGFTLIELMAVVAIIFVLAGVMMVAAARMKDTVYRKRTNAILDVLATACDRYWSMYHDYPYTTPADIPPLPDTIENTNIAYVYLLSEPRQPAPLISVHEGWFEKAEVNIAGPDGRTLFRVVDGYGNFIKVERPRRDHDVNVYVKFISGGRDGDFNTAEDNLERYVKR